MHNRPLLLISLGLSTLFVFSAPAQTAHTAQIVEKIDENLLVALKGNTLPVPNPETDLGQVSPGLAMNDLVLVLSRTSEQQAAFDAFVASQYDPSSLDFHHWLEPVEVGEQFGPSLVDIATVSNWLNSHGFVVTEVSKDRMAIRFSGTAAHVQRAFHTEIHNLLVDGQRHIANMSDPQIPAALAPVVAGVKSLNDFHPRPLHRLGSEVEFDSSTGIWRRIPYGSSLIPGDAASPQSAVVHPEFGITVTTQ